MASLEQNDNISNATSHQASSIPFSRRRGMGDCITICTLPILHIENNWGLDCNAYYYAKLFALAFLQWQGVEILHKNVKEKKISSAHRHIPSWENKGVSMCHVHFLSHSILLNVRQRNTNNLQLFWKAGIIVNHIFVPKHMLKVDCWWRWLLPFADYLPTVIFKVMWFWCWWCLGAHFCKIDGHCLWKEVK